VIREGVVRCGLDDEIEIRHRAVGLALGAVGHGAVVDRQRVFRVEPDRRREVGDGAFIVALLVERVAARRIIGRVLRIVFDRLIEVGDGVVEVALGAVARRARKVGGTLAVERDGFAEVLDRRVVIALLPKRVAAVEIGRPHDARLVAIGVDDHRAGRNQRRRRRVLVETGSALLRVLQSRLGLGLRLLLLLLLRLRLRHRTALRLRRRGLRTLRRSVPALLLLLSPRRQLRESRRCLEQIHCRQRNAAHDVPHSRFHFRLFRLIGADTTPDLSCACTRYRPGGLVNVGVSAGNINPRTTILPMWR
jgi:hypothetical protein